jgi:hypothetical protein
MASFNVLTAQMDDVTELHLEHPVTGPLYADEAEKEPVIITLYGRSSKVHRQWLALALRKQEANRNKKEKTKTPDELMSENAEFFATMTASIKNMTLGDKKLDNKEAYKELYSNPALMWIVEQISEVLGSTEAYFLK